VRTTFYECIKRWTTAKTCDSDGEKNGKDEIKDQSERRETIEGDGFRQDYEAQRLEETSAVGQECDAQKAFERLVRGQQRQRKKYEANAPLREQINKKEYRGQTTENRRCRTVALV